jgi:acyl carrier protein
MQFHESTLKELLAKIFKVPLNIITDDASPDNIDSWDSLQHMNLVLALEGFFGVEMTDDQVVDILSYKLIKLVLEENGIEFI